MAKSQSPMTAAERQRAYRERKKRDRHGIVIPLHAGDGQPPEPPIEDDDEITLAELNARMRRMAAKAFNEVGGTEYLKRVAAKNANTFLRFVGQFVVKDETLNPGAFNIYVQTLTIEGAQPVPGVICSPIAGHIAPPRMQLPPALTVDEEGRDA